MTAFEMDALCDRYDEGYKKGVADAIEMVEELKENVCDHYCRWVYDKKLKSEDELHEKYCSSCPVSNFGKVI